MTTPRPPWWPVCAGVLALAVYSCSDVSVVPVEVDSLTVSPSQLTVAVGDTLRLQATARDESGNVLLDRPIAWSSEDTEVATVQGGLVRGIGPGTVLIRAWSGEAAGQSLATVNEQSSIVLSSGSLAFRATAGAGAPDAQSVEISTGGEEPLSGLRTTVRYASDDATGWLEATLAGTTTPTELSVRVDPSSLAPGTYRADVEVIAPGADNSPQAIEITFELAEALPAVQVSPQTLGFSIAEGEGNPPPAVVQVTNRGAGELTGLDASIDYAEGEPTGWLDTELDGTTAPTELTLRVDTRGLRSPAVLNAVVEVTSPDATSSGRVFVRFTLGEPPPAIQLDPPVIEWDIVENDPSPPTRQVTVGNGGSGTLGGLSTKEVYWSGPGGGWLRATLDSPEAPTVINATLRTTALEPGSYEARIRVRSNDAINSPQSVIVPLRVRPRASGQFSTLSESPSSVVADGVAASTLTVQLRDIRNEDMPSGGDAVQIFTTLGTVSAVSDEGEGRYTATITSTEAGTATITGTVNGEPIADEATVEFVAGPPARVVIVSGDGQTGTVGETLGQELEVRVTDSQDNPVSGVTVTWSPETGDGSASPTSSQTDADGLATTTWTLGSTPGGQTLVASAEGAGSATFEATADVGAPANLAIESGNDQTGTVGAALGGALEVVVTDSEGNPVPGVTVIWAAGDGSASPGSSETDADGVASTTWTLGTTPGGQTLEASVEGVGTVTFDATAVVGAPANVVIADGDDQTGTVGEPLGEPLAVRVTDAQSNPVSGVTVTWAPAAGDGSASPTSSETDADGLASTTWTLGPSPGGQTLSASAAGAGAVTFEATAEVGAPANLVIVGGDDQTGTVGEALGDELEVRVTDAESNPVSGVSVSWTPAGGDGSASPSSSLTDGDGIARTAWTLGSTAGGQTLGASTVGVGTVTFDATAEPGPPANVAIVSGGDQTGTVGEPLGGALEVAVTDSEGNPVPDVTVTWSPATGDGSASPPSSQTNGSGVASTTWTLGSTPGAQELEASVPGAGTVTFEATAEIGPPAIVVIAGGNDQTGPVGEALTEELTVLVTDSEDNPVSGVTVTWSPAAGDGSAAPTASQTDADGFASTTWTLGSTPGGQTLAADAGVGTVVFDATATEGAQPESDP